VRPALLSRSATALLTLVAFGLRVHDLGAQSLWYDEAFSDWLARQDLGAITARTAADIHPPLYYYLLHFWLQLTGESEFALRYLSLLGAVLLVPAVYLLAAWSVGRWRGSALAPALAAALVAIAPAWVWYGQEARMYSLVTLAGALAMAIFAGLLTGRAPRSARSGCLAALLALDVVAIYVHFYAIFLLVVQGVALVVWWGARASVEPRPHPDPQAGTPLPEGEGILSPLGASPLSLWERGTRLRVGVRARPSEPVLAVALTLVLAGAAFLPWAGFALTRLEMDTSYYAGELPAATVARQTLALFGGGHSLPEEAGLALAGLMLALGVLGVTALYRRGGGFAAAMLGLYLLMPPVLLYVISFNRPKFHPRYLLLAEPPLFVLAAVGLAVLLAPVVSRRFPVLWAGRKPPGAPASHLTVAAGGARPALEFVQGLAGAVTLLALVAGSLAGVAAIGDPAVARDDWRSVAAYLRAHVGPEDGIVLMSGHAGPALAYYYPDGVWVPVPEEPTLSTQSVIGYSFAGTLNALAKEKRRLWLLRWQADVVDPNDYAGELLAAKSQRLPVDRTFAGIDLQLWTLPSGVEFESAPRVQYPREVNYDRRVKLIGYDLAAPELPSGETLRATLYWQALARLDADYKLALRLKDADGHFWGRADRRPAQYFFPSTRWRPGEVIFGKVDLAVPPGTPPGDYTLEAELYTEAAEGNRGLSFLDAAGAPAGTAAPLGSVRVTPAAQPALPPPAVRLQARLGAVSLAGAGPAPAPLLQGDRLTLAAQWEAAGAPGADLNVVARLARPEGGAVAERRFPLGGPGYPTSRWPAGARVAGQYDLLVPADAPAGMLLVQLGLAEGAAAPAQFATVYPISVRVRPRQTVLPPMQRRVDLEWPALGTLAGYDLDRTTAAPGDTVLLTLYWVARRPVTAAYTVFAHLLDGGNQLRGQHDSPPNGGQTPTTGWAPGEAVVDRHPIPIKPDTPKGSLQIEVGLYDAATGERLRLADGTDHAILGTIELK
jgi:4-amino-4-deoxy-L-arabinose transferase-like glycosyltransferase